jgi:phage-related protein
MISMIPSILSLIGQILPLIGTGASATSAIGGVISTITQILPLAVDGAQTIIPAIKNVLSAVSAHPATTADQLTTVQALDAQCDTAFDAAMAAFDSGAPSA